MPIAYEKASPATMTMLADVQREHHPYRLDCVTIGVLMASAGEDKDGNPKPAVKVHGVEALAKIRVVGLRDRAHDMPDAQIVIDAACWDRASDDERRALLDHELTHLSWVGRSARAEFDTDGKTGEITESGKRDDLGRPKLRMRLHDYELAGFDEVARRHGRAAPEVRAVEAFADTRGQIYLPGMHVAEAKRVDAPRERAAAMLADPGMRKAVERFHDAMTAGGTTCVIEAGDKKVVLKPRAKAGKGEART